MNTIRLVVLLLVLVASRLVAGAAGSAEAADSLDSPDAEPPAAPRTTEPAAAPAPAPALALAPEGPRDFGRLMPRRLQAGVQIGLLGSRLQATPEYRALLAPAEARVEAWKSMSWGAVLTARWNHGFSLTVSPRRETYGIETREQTVAFPDNPFPHTLKSSTRLAYMVLPMQLGMGWQGPRQRFEVGLGIYGAWLLHSDIRWIVDGEEYANRPAASAVDHNGWLVSTGYGFQLGSGEILVGLEAQQGLESLLGGMAGSVRSRSLRAQAAYLWTLSRR